jgi:Ni,Fe-hydrogenase III component G
VVAVAAVVVAVSATVVVVEVVAVVAAVLPTVVASVTSRVPASLSTKRVVQESIGSCPLSQKVWRSRIPGIA